jgi:hypothetical protein
MAWHLRPVAGQHPLAERVDLDLADDGHAGALEAEVESAYAGEKGQDVHTAPPKHSRHGCRQSSRASASVVVLPWPKVAMPQAVRLTEVRRW